MSWYFENATFLTLETFLEHIDMESDWGNHGFNARPANYGSSNDWEILCPALVHKVQITCEYLTQFVAKLPEGTKINIGGFKNV